MLTGLFWEVEYFVFYKLEWSINIDKNNELTQPNIESINYLDTSCEVV